MRILHMASGDAWGGAERVLCLLVEGARCHPELEVEVLLLNEGQLADQIRRLGTRVTVIPEASRSFVSLCFEVRRWLRAHRFDVLHAHRYKELALAVCTAVPRSSGVVVTVHGLELWSQMRLRDAFRTWSIPFLAYLYGSWFVAVSKEIERRLHRYLGKSRVVQVANPMPPVRETFGDSELGLRARLGWAESQKLIGFVGRLEQVKGPDLFVDIASLCSPDVGFVVIGAGSMRQDLETRARSHQLESRVRFLGQVSDAIPYIRQFDVLALTSRHEGQPLVLLEAAACNVPIVAFDVGGVREILSGASSARLVPFGDLTRFANNLSEVLGANGSLAETVCWGNALRARHGLSAATASYLEVYRSALRGERETRNARASGLARGKGEDS